MAEVVYLIGNGLSVGVSPTFRVDALTAKLNESLSATTRAALIEIATLGRPDSAIGVTSATLGFEDYAGPIDRIAAALRTLAPLAEQGQSSAVLWDAYEYLRGRYLQLAGTVLAEIASATSLGATDKWEELNRFADEIRGLHVRHPSAVFTLPYDTLLESAMIEAHCGWFYDGFAGPDLILNDPLHCFPGRMPVYHLHGSVLWYQSPDDIIGKSRSDSESHRDQMEKWKVGDDSAGLPVVILTDLKTRAAAQYPFDLFYAEFWDELAGARHLVVGGYGFNDTPVNQVIRRWLIDRVSGYRRTLEIWAPGDMTQALAALDLPEDAMERVESLTMTLPDPQIVRNLGTRLDARRTPALP
jgi:hypothetical protein